MRYFNKDSLDYEFVDKLEAGLVLTGSDAKSLRVSPPQFIGTRVDITGGRPFLNNLYIQPYKYSQNQVTDKTSSRALLLSQKEIAKLVSLRHQKYMLIPITIYTRGKWLKVEIGIGRKMRKYEKREKIKQKELKKTLR